MVKDEERDVGGGNIYIGEGKRESDGQNMGKVERRGDSRNILIWGTL